MGQHATRSRRSVWPAVLLTLAFLQTVGDGPLVGRASAEDLSARLKAMLGMPDGADRAKIEEAFAEDMNTHAATIPEESRNYRGVLKFYVSVIAERNRQFVVFNEEILLLKEQLAAIRAEQDAAIRAASDRAQTELATQLQRVLAERADLKKECVELDTDRTQLGHELNACRKQMAAMAATAEKHADENAQLKAALLRQRAEAKPAAKPEAAVRVWTDASGQHRVEAVLVKVEDGKVFLRKRDGSVVALPLEKLSRDNQEYLRRRGEGP